MRIMRRMYDPIKLQERMAELVLNPYQLGTVAGVDPKTAKSFVTTGKGNPETVRKITKALKFKNASEIVLRHIEKPQRKTA